MKFITMVHANGEIETVKANFLPFILKAINEKAGTRKLTMTQYMAIAKGFTDSDKVELKFCGRTFTK